MGRIAGEHFNNLGRPKKAYESRDAALEDARAYSKKIYQCGTCGLYHLGGRHKWKGYTLAPWLGDPKAVKKCKGSRRYKDEYAAKQSAKSKGGGTPYRCPVPSCNSWHLTS